MPIILPADLPAALHLGAEGLNVLSPAKAWGQPRLRIGLINLMPDKPTTELQFARLLANGHTTVELMLLRVVSHTSRNTRQDHLARFYRRWDALRANRLDGAIVTGAPLEHLPFEAVDFWDEFKDILSWAESEVGRTLLICWAAQAALHHRYGVAKRLRREKAFGVFEQQVQDNELPVLQGLHPSFPTPVSRHSELRADDLPKGAGLRLGAGNPETGVSLVAEPARRSLYMLDHLEYGPRTLRREYLRDRLAGRPIAPPVNDPADPLARRAPTHPWRAHAELFFRNWLAEVDENRCMKPCWPTLTARRAAAG
jgi:homoserine O-succinyltransferase